MAQQDDDDYKRIYKLVNFSTVDPICFYSPCQNFIQPQWSIWVPFRSPQFGENVWWLVYMIQWFLFCYKRDLKIQSNSSPVDPENFIQPSKILFNLRGRYGPLCERSRPTIYIIGDCVYEVSKIVRRLLTLRTLALNHLSWLVGWLVGWLVLRHLYAYWVIWFWSQIKLDLQLFTGQKVPTKSFVKTLHIVAKQIF